MGTNERPPSTPEDDARARAWSRKIDDLAEAGELTGDDTEWLRTKIEGGFVLADLPDEGTHLADGGYFVQDWQGDWVGGPWATEIEGHQWAHDTQLDGRYEVRMRWETSR